MEFRHAVVRAALLGQMSAARRQRLHRDIATVLERAASSAPADHLAALAHHHDLARSPEASEWYRRAARAATDAFDVGAVQLAERGLELLAGTDADPALRCDLLIARAMGLRLAGHETLADARMAAEAAIALGDEDAHRQRAADAERALDRPRRVRTTSRSSPTGCGTCTTPARRAAGPSPSGCRCAR